MLFPHLHVKLSEESGQNQVGQELCVTELAFLASVVCCANTSELTNNVNSSRLTNIILILSYVVAHGSTINCSLLKPLIARPSVQPIYISKFRWKWWLQNSVLLPAGNHFLSSVIILAHKIPQNTVKTYLVSYKQIGDDNEMFVQSEIWRLFTIATMTSTFNFSAGFWHIQSISHGDYQQEELCSHTIWLSRDPHRQRYTLDYFFPNVFFFLPFSVKTIPNPSCLFS